MHTWKTASRDDYLDVAADALAKLLKKGMGKLKIESYGDVLGQALVQSISTARWLQTKTVTTQNLWIRVKWQSCELENCHYGFCWIHSVQRRNWKDKEEAFKLTLWDNSLGDADPAQFGADAAAAIDAKIKELCPN